VEGVVQDFTCGTVVAETSRYWAVGGCWICVDAWPSCIGPKPETLFLPVFPRKVLDQPPLPGCDQRLFWRQEGIRNVRAVIRPPTATCHAYRSHVTCSFSSFTSSCAETPTDVLWTLVDRPCVVLGPLRTRDPYSFFVECPRGRRS